MLLWTSKAVAANQSGSAIENMVFCVYVCVCVYVCGRGQFEWKTSDT